MNKILVTYLTNAGSTAKVAQAVADELGKNATVETLPLDKVTRFEPYFAVVLGAPMILGWHLKNALPRQCCQKLPTPNDSPPFWGRFSKFSCACRLRIRTSITC